MSGWHRKKPTAAGKARAKDYASAEHQAIAKQRKAAATPLTPCTCPGKSNGGCKHHTGPCGKPLGPNTREWHTPHNASRTGYLPGLWCGACNRSEAASRAARKTNAQRKQARTGTSTLRW